MNPVSALKNAANCIRLAEDAKDEPSRKRYARLAEAWLELASLQDWLEGKISPVLTKASNEGGHA